MAINKVKIQNQSAVPVHDERWQEESTTIMTTPLNLRVGYDYDQRDNTGGGKIYFGDGDNAYIGEGGSAGDDSDDIIMHAENTAYVTASDIDLDASGDARIYIGSDDMHIYANDLYLHTYDDGPSNVYINGTQIRDAAFKSAGQANGVATLDNSGKVPTSQLPSYVDDVLEYGAQSLFPATGESGKIYVDVSTNTTWRWSGSAYVQIKGDLAIGTATGTAADGGIVTSHVNDRSNPHNVTKSQIGLSNVENKSAATILSELTTSNITTALGYTPLRDSDLDRDHTIKSGDFLVGINYGPNSGKYKQTIYQNDINDKLYAANYRFTVTHKVFDSSTDEYLGEVGTYHTGNGTGLRIFEGNEEIAGNFVAEGEYAELYIGAAPEDEIEDATGYWPNMWVYGDDSHMFLTFYYGHLPGTITAKWYEKYTNSWHDATVNKLNDHKYEIVMEGQTTFMAAIKVTYEGAGSESASGDWGKPTSLTDVRLFGRRTTVQEQSNLVKYPIQQQIYGTLIGPRFQTTGGTSSQFVKGDGSLDSNTYVTSSSIQSLASTVGSHINNSTIHVTAAEKDEWSGKQDQLYIEEEVQGGQDESLVSTGEKYTWNHKQDKLTIATSVSSGNTNPVTSGAVYTAIHNYTPTPDFSSGGLVLPVKMLTWTSYTITKNDVIIITTNSSNSKQTLTLPSSPTVGQTYMIRIGNNGSVELKSPSGYYLTQNGVMTSTTTSYSWSSGLPVMAIYAGNSRWQLFRAESAT